MNKEHATDKLETDVTPTPYPINKQSSTKTNTDLQDSTNKKPYSQPKNMTDKKEFYPGPFSPQYFSKNENVTHEQKPVKKPSHEILTDILSPFHLEKFAGDIEKELHANVTDEKEKKGKKPTKTHIKEDEEEDGDEDTYDEKNQYEDLFTDIFESKNKNKNTSKHSFWTVKPPEIPELVKNPQLQDSKPLKEKDQDTAKHPINVETPTSTVDFPKKHNQEKENNLYTNKKQKPHDDNTKYDIKVPENAGNFIPFPNGPYSIPQGIYPNINPALKYPPPEILIHQGQNPANQGFSHKFKSPPISDPNQSEEFFHIIDNDAYNEDQIRQHLHYNGQQEVHPQFQQVLKLHKGGIRVPNQPNEHNGFNVEDVLTHLHHESNNNNVHLPNILPGPVGHQHQLPNVLHNFGFQNYHETLNTDQTSHPLLLHPELSNQAGNDTNRGLFDNTLS